MRTWKEDALRHKYDPLPDEPRHRKRARKSHVRSDHKHDYEIVCVDDGTLMWDRNGKHVGYTTAKRCRICGRVKDTRLLHSATEPPEGLPLYRTPGSTWFLDGGILREEWRAS